MTLIYGVIILTALSGFVSLGVDWGHVQMVKTQLQQAADAAARAAVSQLSTNNVTTIQNTAVTWAGLNKADMSSVVVDPTNDVDFGTWTPGSRTFTVLTGASRTSANSIRVWAHRTAANGSPVHLAFGAVLGRSTCDVNVSAIAYSLPASGKYGIVGLNSVTLSSTVNTNSYASSLGSYGSQTAGTKGYVACNGTVKLQTSTTVSQDVYMVSGQTLTVTGGSTYGTRNTVSTIVWPTPSAGTYATSNDNGSLGLPTTGASASFSYGSFSVPPGHYYLDSLSISGGTITISGPTTIYMHGPLSISGGTFNVTSGHPSDLMIYMVIASTLTISGGSDLMADIQAPTSTVSVSNVANVYGRLIGKDLTVTTTDVHVDTSLPAVTGASTPNGGTGGSIQTVR